MAKTWIPTRQTIEDKIREEEIKLAEAREVMPRFSYAPQFSIIEPPPEQVQRETMRPLTTEKWMPEYTPETAMPTAMPQAMPTTQKPEYEWYEKPKEWTEAGMEKVGEVISKVPVLPEFMKWAEPGFEFIHEKIEKPWAEFVTAPFRGGVPYEQWEAPTYAKGAAEFSMPLWWIPWLGWGAKAARAAGVSAKAAKFATRVRKILPDLPPQKMLEEAAFKPDNFRKFANWLSTKPVLGSMVKAIGGMSASVKPGLETIEQLGKQQITLRGALLERGSSASELAMSHLRAISPNPRKLFDVGDDFTSKAIKPKKAGVSQAIGDIFENPLAYKLTVEQARYIKTTHKIIDEIVAQAEKEGIQISKREFLEGMHYFPRIATGKVTEGGLELVRVGIGGRIGAKPWFQKTRVYETMMEGAKAGTIYAGNPDRVMSMFLRGMFKQIADKRFADAVKKAGGMYKASKQPFGWQTLPYPAFGPKVFPVAGGKALAFSRQRYFPPELVKLVRSTFEEQSMKWVRNAAAISGVGRMLVAAMDFSAPFIQGLPVLGYNPALWLKSTIAHYKYFFNPQALHKEIVKRTASIKDRIYYGSYSGGFEYFEAMGTLQRAIGKIPLVGKYGQGLVRQTYGRAEAAFQGFGEIARDGMWRGMRGITKASELPSLARSIDRMTGVMSTRALGIGLTQRELEQGFGFFSPRYTRAGMALASDILKGGLSGKMARESLGHLIAGGTAFYIGMCRLTEQQPNLDPTSGKFLTIKIGEHHFGIGGITYALMRLAGNVTGTAIEEPIDLATLSKRDNPFISFLYSRTAPLTGFTVEALEQKNFFGEPFEDFEDWAKWLASNVTPIALQTVYQEEGTTPPVMAGELMGMRTFPKSAYELRDETRNRYALFEYNKMWDDLNRLEQRVLERSHSEIKTMALEADEISKRRGAPQQQLFYEWQDERSNARFEYERMLWGLAGKVELGKMTGYDFRKQAQRLGSELGGAYKAIDRNERYTEIRERLTEKKDLTDRDILDIAYDEWASTMYSGEMEDPQTGEYDFDKAAAFREDFIRRYGEPIYRQVLETLMLGRNIPPIMKEYHQAVEVLRPYWKIRDDIIAQFGEPKTPYQETKLNQVVSRLRKRLRMINPEVAKYYDLFYKRS